MPKFFDACDKYPLELWKGVDAQSLDRIVLKSDRDMGRYYAMTVRDGDNAPTWTSQTSKSGGYGERVEVGRNSLTSAPFLYREGDHATTVMRYRLPKGYPINEKLFQSVCQMKQTGPSSYSPALGFNAQRGGWEILHTNLSGVTTRLWTTPAKLSVLTELVVEAVYSSDPSKGEISLTVNGVKSPVFKTNTLLHAPAHLRRGIYRFAGLSYTTNIHIGSTLVF